MSSSLLALIHLKDHWRMVEVGARVDDLGRG